MTTTTDVPQVDAEKLLAPDCEWDSLDDHEKLWLQNMGQAPADAAPQPVYFYDGATGQQISNDPAFFEGKSPANQARIDALVEARAKELVKDLLLQEQVSAQAVAGEYTGTATGPRTGGTVPTGMVVSDDTSLDELYPDWESSEYASKNNEELRTELSQRPGELSTVGRKEILVKRLLADDEGTSLPGEGTASESDEDEDEADDDGADD